MFRRDIIVLVSEVFLLSHRDEKCSHGTCIVLSLAKHDYTHAGLR